MARTSASFYKKRAYQVLSEIVVRMGGSYSIDFQSIAEILRKVLPERKDVDRNMVYNVRLSAVLELEAGNVEVLGHNFDTSFIKDYKSNSDNYS